MKMMMMMMLPILVVTLFVSQCSTNSDNPVTAVEGAKSIEIAIKTADGFDTIASGAIARVSGEDMKLIECKLAVSSSSIHGTITRIPVGINRLFEVIVYDFHGNVIYTGSATADIDPVKVTRVTIVLRKFEGGTAEINGTFEDIYAPCSTIWFTSIFGGRSDSNNDKKTIEVMITACAMSDHWRQFNPDTFEYRWEVQSQYNTIKTDWAPATQQGIVSQLPVQCLYNDEVHAYVYARCARHPEIIGRDSVTVTVKNGSATLFWNSIYPYTYVDTVEFDMGPTDTIHLSFKEGEDVCMHLTGTWCMSKDICWEPNGEKDAKAGERFLYPEFPAGAFLVKSSEFSEIGLFNGGDCWYFDRDVEWVCFVNRLKPKEQGNESGTIHVYYLRKGGRVDLPGMQ